MELNALCMKLGKKPIYKPVDAYQGMRPAFNYNIRAPGPYARSMQQYALSISIYVYRCITSFSLVLYPVINLLAQKRYDWLHDVHYYFSSFWAVITTHFLLWGQYCIIWSFQSVVNSFTARAAHVRPPNMTLQPKLSNTCRKSQYCSK